MLEHHDERGAVEDNSRPLKSQRLRRLATLSACVTVFTSAIQLGWMQCPFARWLRLPCPGCGTTRAALALARGDVEEAMRWNPASPALVPALAALLAYCAYHFVRDGRVCLDDVGPRRVSLAIALALTWIWALRWVGLFGGPVAI
jgi:hypothetical protein